MDYHTDTYFHIFYISDKHETYALVLVYGINACSEKHWDLKFLIFWQDIYNCFTVYIIYVT